MYRAAADAHPADWVVASLGPLAESVLSLVPAGFCEYVRVLHPAYRRHGCDSPPLTGALPPDYLARLAEILARHTQTAGRCYFAVWHGLGGLPPSVTVVPTFSVPGRTYHLLAGPLQAVHEIVASIGPYGGPHLWWPHDHAWCVATDIDLKSTYVGAGRACAEDLTSSPELEAYTVAPESGIDWLSDALNPRPASA